MEQWRQNNNIQGEIFSLPNAANAKNTGDLENTEHTNTMAIAEKEPSKDVAELQTELQAMKEQHQHQMDMLQKKMTAQCQLTNARLKEMKEQMENCREQQGKGREREEEISQRPASPGPQLEAEYETKQEGLQREIERLQRNVAEQCRQMNSRLDRHQEELEQCRKQRPLRQEAGEDSHPEAFDLDKAMEERVHDDTHRQQSVNFSGRQESMTVSDLHEGGVYNDTNRQPDVSFSDLGDATAAAIRMSLKDSEKGLFESFRNLDKAVEDAMKTSGDCKRPSRCYATSLFEDFIDSFSELGDEMELAIQNSLENKDGALCPDSAMAEEAHPSSFRHLSDATQLAIQNSFDDAVVEPFGPGEGATMSAPMVMESKGLEEDVMALVESMHPEKVASHAAGATDKSSKSDTDGSSLSCQKTKDASGNREDKVGKSGGKSGKNRNKSGKSDSKRRKRRPRLGASSRVAHSLVSWRELDDATALAIQNSLNDKDKKLFKSIRNLGEAVDKATQASTYSKRPSRERNASNVAQSLPCAKSLDRATALAIHSSLNDQDKGLFESIRNMSRAMEEAAQDSSDSSEGGSKRQVESSVGMRTAFLQEKEHRREGEAKTACIVGSRVEHVAEPAPHLDRLARRKAVRRLANGRLANSVTHAQPKGGAVARPDATTLSAPAQHDLSGLETHRANRRSAQNQLESSTTPALSSAGNETPLDPDRLTKNGLLSLKNHPNRRRSLPEKERQSGARRKEAQNRLIKSMIPVASKIMGSAVSDANRSRASCSTKVNSPARDGAAAAESVMNSETEEASLEDEIAFHGGMDLLGHDALMMPPIPPPERRKKKNPPQAILSHFGKK